MKIDGVVKVYHISTIWTLYAMGKVPLVFHINLLNCPNPNLIYNR
jgi:hypothetical protein